MVSKPGTAYINNISYELYIFDHDTEWQICFLWFSWNQSTRTDGIIGDSVNIPAALFFFFGGGRGGGGGCGWVIVLWFYDPINNVQIMLVGMDNEANWLGSSLFSKEDI